MKMRYNWQLAGECSLHTSKAVEGVLPLRPPTPTVNEQAPGREVSPHPFQLASFNPSKACHVPFASFETY